MVWNPFRRKPKETPKPAEPERLQHPEGKATPEQIERILNGEGRRRAREQRVARFKAIQCSDQGFVQAARAAGKDPQALFDEMFLKLHQTPLVEKPTTLWEHAKAVHAQNAEKIGRRIAKPQDEREQDLHLSMEKLFAGIIKREKK